MYEVRESNILVHELLQPKVNTGAEQLWIKQMQDKISGVNSCVYKRAFRTLDLEGIKAFERARLNKNLGGSLVHAFNTLVGKIRIGVK